jgi:hypothetical protein
LLWIACRFMFSAKNQQITARRSRLVSGMPTRRRACGKAHSEGMSADPRVRAAAWVRGWSGGPVMAQLNRSGRAAGSGWRCRSYVGGGDIYR